jgi:putative phage-type endonuclease
MLTKEQLEERRGYIGASDAAAVLGLSRWTTPLEVWAEKTGAIQAEDISGKLHIEVGNELEDLVCRLFTKRTGKTVRRVNETQDHPNYSFIKSNIDRRIVGSDEILEAKTCSGWKAKEWDGEDIPAEYIIQCQHQLAVTGKQRAWIAVLIGGNQDFLYKPIDRDNGLIKDIIEREADFWTKYVEPRVMPQTVTAGDSDILLKLFPDADESAAVNLGADADELAQEVKEMQGEVKELDDLIEQRKNQLRLMLGANAAGVTDRYKVTWRPQTTERLDLARFKQEKPDVYKSYLKESSSRVLRVSPIKNKTEKEKPANV